jgi:hypothetical protein
LLDLDGVRWAGNVSDRKAAANLARLARIALVLPRERRRPDFQSLLSLGQRGRFLEQYLTARGLDNWRWWWKEIDRIANRHEP